MDESKEVTKTRRLKFGGGPHGLGDPDDKSLRKVERDVLIPKIIRDRSRTEKCVKEVAEFSECCKNSSVLMVVKCQAPNKVLQECLKKWYLDKDFNEECKQQYLDRRTEYRRTGIPRKSEKGTRIQSM